MRKPSMPRSDEPRGRQELRSALAKAPRLGQLPKEWREQVLKERHRARQAALAFECACKSGNPDALSAAAQMLDEPPTPTGWFQAMKRTAALGSVSEDIQYAFVAIWTERKHLPLVVSHRPTMARALHVLLPKTRHHGAPIPLFRGTLPNEHRYSRNGFSWTSDRDVADRFAQDRRNPDGAVVLETLADADAVMYVRKNEGYYEESEHIVDPYKLIGVKVLLCLPAESPGISC